MNKCLANSETEHLVNFNRLTCFLLLCDFRYGSHLVLVESYDENNATATLAARSIGSPSAGGSPKYWLGLTSLDDLRTNTLEAAAGLLVSQYSGEFNDCISLILLGFKARTKYAPQDPQI